MKADEGRRWPAAEVEAGGSALGREEVVGRIGDGGDADGACSVDSYLMYRKGGRPRLGWW